jgi:hypothetical protein
MGLFHLEMACADAIWWIFIKPMRAREDSSSLMAFVALYCPHETGKIGSGPGFHHMHEVIQHNGIALWLDVWWTEARLRNPSWQSLDDFAASNPTMEAIHQMADYMAAHYVAGGDVDIFSVRSKAAMEHDEQNENVLLMHQYLINLFWATGKHKYAANMTNFLTDVHYVYPEKLKYVRLS